MSTRAGWNGFADRIWPAGRSLVTPALDHNFWTWNPSRSSKVSKDLDCSLVSNKNFSKILPSNGWRPGPDEVWQGGLKALHLWRHSQKIRTLTQKIFSSADYKICRVFWDLDQVSSAYQTGEIPTQNHVRFCVFFRKSPKAAGCQSVKPLNSSLAQSAKELWRW